MQAFEEASASAAAELEEMGAGELLLMSPVVELPHNVLDAMLQHTAYQVRSCTLVAITAFFRGSWFFGVLGFLDSLRQITCMPCGCCTCLHAWSKDGRGMRHLLLDIPGSVFWASDTLASSQAC